MNHILFYLEILQSFILILTNVVKIYILAFLHYLLKHGKRRTLSLLFIRFI